MKSLEIQASLKGINLIITLVIKVIMTSVVSSISNEHHESFINNII
jgi:hypothetical protein